jgi:ABC-type Fe3+-hydroxamate transport system substrate-binding protein
MYKKIIFLYNVLSIEKIAQLDPSLFFANAVEQLAMVKKPYVKLDRERNYGTSRQE